MTTTHLFVELLVIGFGALLWVILFAAALLGFDLKPFLGNITTVGALGPALSVAYVLGILVDRVADWSFDWIDKRQRKDYFSDIEVYFNARRTMLVKGKELWAHLEYGRSRMRICRGWTINALALVLTLDIYIFTQAPKSLGSPGGLILSNIFLLFFGCLCFVSWQKLNTKEYEKIHRQSEWVKKMDSQN